jgi:flagellar hook-basal body complex protein FliE
MADPLGFISGPSSQRPIGPAGPVSPGAGQGPTFKDVLLKNIEEVNRLQQDANQATEDLMTGQRDDPEQVMTAIAKADLAFKTLQAVRNQVIRAYDEVQQMRV